MNNLVITDANQLAKKDMTIDYELYDRFISFLDASPKTIETYTRNLRQFFKFLSNNLIIEPKREDIIAYREYLKQELNLKPTTIQAYIIVVRLFFQWTAQEGMYPNVAEKVKGAKISTLHKKDPLTTNQAKDIISSFDRSTEAGARNYAIFSLMITGGLRDIEVQRANLEDLRILGDDTVLYIQGKGKDEKTDYVKIPYPVEKAIREYLKFRSSIKASEPLFSSTSNNNRGMRLTTRSISSIVKKAFKSSGYDSDRLTAHSLRHTAGTLNLLNGGSLEDTQQLLRHQNINTTMIYLHHIDRAKNQSEERIAKALF